MSRSQLLNHVKALQDEINILRGRLLPSATGYLHTTIGTLENRIKECQKIIDEERIDEPD